MKEYFHEAEPYASQPVVFESDHVEFKFSSGPQGNWTIKCITSCVVS